MVTETMLKSIMMRSRGSISYHTSGYMLELRYNVCRIPKGFMYLTSSLFPRLYLKRSNHHNSIVHGDLPTRAAQASVIR